MSNLVSYQKEDAEEFRYDPQFFADAWIQRVIGNPLSIAFNESAGGAEVSEDELQHEDAKTICRKVYDRFVDDEELGAELRKRPQVREELENSIVNRLKGLETEKEEALQERLERVYQQNCVSYEVVEEQGITRHRVDGEVVLEYKTPTAVASAVSLTGTRGKALIALYLDLAFFLIDSVFFVLAVTNALISTPRRQGKDLGKSVLEAIEDGKGRLKAVFQRLLNGLEINWRDALKDLRQNIRELGKLQGARKWWRETNKISFIKSFMRSIKPVLIGHQGIKLVAAILRGMSKLEIAKLTFGLGASITIFVATAGTSMLAALAAAFGWTIIVIIDLVDLVEDKLAVSLTPES